MVNGGGTVQQTWQQWYWGLDSSNYIPDSRGCDPSMFSSVKLCASGKMLWLTCFSPSRPYQVSGGLESFDQIGYGTVIARSEVGRGGVHPPFCFFGKETQEDHGGARQMGCAAHHFSGMPAVILHDACGVTGVLNSVQGFLLFEYLGGRHALCLRDAGHHL